MGLPSKKSTSGGGVYKKNKNNNNTSQDLIDDFTKNPSEDACCASANCSVFWKSLKVTRKHYLSELLTII